MYNEGEVLNMIRRKGFIRILVMLLFAFLPVSLSFAGTKASAGKKTAMQSLNLHAFKVSAPADIPIVLRYPARTKSTGRVTIVARVAGTLQEMLFKEGQRVKKGDILFKIEQDPYQAEFERANAALTQAEAELKRAERDWKRVKASFEDGVASEQQRDTALSAYETAKAQVGMAKAALKEAELNLQYTVLRATISGIAGMRLVDVGNYLSAETPVVTITKTDPIYVEFSIPDADLIRHGITLQRLKELKERLTAEIQMEGRAYNHTGRIDFIDTLLDDKTSTLKARALFPNPVTDLLPGQFVRISIKGLSKRAIVVPQKAVIQSPLGAMVFVIKDGKVEARPIKIGDESGENFIVEEGVNPGELIALDNLMKIRPGMPVKVDGTVNE